ncbi:MAG: hydrogenase small subunit [Chloroflexi bacterium]|nr:hydrogenase small subunit [Chloroflexota bacterium]
MAKEIAVIWFQAASCTGCSVSLLNSASPTIKNVLVDQIIPGVHINLRFHATVMAGQGEPVIKVLEDTARDLKGGYVLIAEGGIPTKQDAMYGAMGERNNKPVSMAQRIEELASNALAVLSVGTCASFGGISAASPNPSGCLSISEFLKQKKINKPLINIPGCPPHPEWIVGTIADIILNGIPTPDKLDDYGRPLVFYGKLIHENCPNRAYFDEGKFATKIGEAGCLYKLGCKGPVTYADCPTRHWNSGTNWVIGAGAPCNGCTQPEYPDDVSPFYEKISDDVELKI